MKSRKIYVAEITAFLDDSRSIPGILFITIISCSLAPSDWPTERQTAAALPSCRTNAISQPLFHVRLPAVSDQKITRFGGHRSKALLPLPPPDITARCTFTLSNALRDANHHINILYSPKVVAITTCCLSVCSHLSWTR